MTNVAMLTDPNHFLHPVKAAARVATINAGDVGANGALAGTPINLLALPRTFRSVELAAPFRITQAAGKSVTVKVKGQHRSSTTGAGSTWADLLAADGGSTGSKLVSSTGATDSQAVTGVRLEGAKKWFRTVITPTFSATTTGPTLDVDAPVAVFVGPDRTPAQG